MEHGDNPKTDNVKLLKIPVVSTADWAEKIGSAETAGSAIVIFYTSAFAATTTCQELIEKLVTRILPQAGPHKLFRFILDEHPTFARDLIRRLGIWNIRIQQCGVLWSGNGTSYVLGDAAFESTASLDQNLIALAANRGIDITLGLASAASAVELPLTSASQMKTRRPLVIAGSALVAVISAFALFSGDPAYVGECRSLWWENSGKSFPAVDISYRRVGNGEMTRYTDGRLVGYYTDFIITLKFDNFGQQGRVNLQCVANSQKTFVYMKTDDRDWIGGKPGPIGTSFVLANGKYSRSQPSLD